MPPVNQFLAENSTDWSLAASWVDNVGVASTVPVSTDNTRIMIGRQTIANGLSNAAVDLTTLMIGDKFMGNLGSNGTSLEIAVFQTSTGVFTYQAGGGVAYVKAGTAGIHKCLVQGRGKLFLTGGVFSILEVSRGSCDCNDQTNLNAKVVRIFGGDTTIAFRSGDAPTQVDVYGGVVRLYRPPTTLNIYDGSVILYVDRSANSAATLNQTGGSCRLLGGNVPIWNIYNGTFDASDASRPITLGGTTTIIGANANILVNPLVTLPTTGITLLGRRTGITGSPATQ